MSSRNEVFKKIVIDDITIRALVDTGSLVSLIREDIYYKLQPQKFYEAERIFTSFGKGKSKTLGYSDNNSYRLQRLSFDIIRCSSRCYEYGCSYW